SGSGDQPHLDPRDFARESVSRSRRPRVVRVAGCVGTVSSCVHHRLRFPRSAASLCHACLMSTSPAPGRTAAEGPVVLVVEDEQAIAVAVARRLAAEGMRAHAVGDGQAGVDAAARLRPDLVILDVMLPGIDGLEVCRRIQAERPVPVLMLTARDDETDMLVGLGVGADDYMTKPFSMRELVARSKALLRRAERAREAAAQESAAAADLAPIEAGEVVIDRAQRRVSRAGTDAHLTPTEFDLLVTLASSPKTVLTR